MKAQENGDVIISNTVSNPTDKGFTITTTTTLSKVTVDEICQLVKDKDKKPKPQLGKWYKVTNLKNGCLGFPDIGFFTDEKHTDGICGSIDGFNLKTINGRVWRVNGDFSELPPETVEQYLRDEFIRLGWNENCIVETDNKWILKGNIEFKFVPEQNILQLWSDYGKCLNSDNEQNYRSALNVFNNGKFATIIKPETITRAEAEKRYDVKITD